MNRLIYEEGLNRHMTQQFTYTWNMGDALPRTKTDIFLDSGLKEKWETEKTSTSGHMWHLHLHATRTWTDPHIVLSPDKSPWIFLPSFAPPQFSFSLGRTSHFKRSPLPGKAQQRAGGGGGVTTKINRYKAERVGVKSWERGRWWDVLFS